MWGTGSAAALPRVPGLSVLQGGAGSSPSGGSCGSQSLRGDGDGLWCGAIVLVETTALQGAS